MNYKLIASVMLLGGLTVLVGQVAADGEADEANGPIDLTKTDGAKGGYAFGGDIGPDVAVSRLGLTSGGTGTDDFDYYGAATDPQTGTMTRAFAMASTSCNVGDETAEWISGSTGRHPVIAQNIFRLHDGKFEQIGYSWMKHSFCAVSETTCGTCQATSCSTLGIGCADTYWAGLNDGAGGGPKWNINPQGLGLNGTTAATHLTPHPFPAPQGPTAIRGRLQIHDEDIINNTDADYFAEVQYVTHDEELRNRHNNASWREVQVFNTAIVGVGTGQATVQFEQPAIRAWKDKDPEVTIIDVDVPEEGRFHLAYRVYDNGDGTWNYEYALHNLNSDRAARSFMVPHGANVQRSAIGFNDIHTHSAGGNNDPYYDTTDWAITEGPTSTRWTTDAWADNQLANAVRWGTLYNYRFTANTPPETGEAVIGLYKPGTPTELTVANVLVPSAGELCPADFDGNGAIDINDLLQLLAAWGDCPGCIEDLNFDGVVDIQDLLDLLAVWGPC
jgi:hypothetical protein